MYKYLNNVNSANMLTRLKMSIGKTYLWIWSGLAHYLTVQDIHYMGGIIMKMW